jgi:hypothetical protein
MGSTAEETVNIVLKGEGGKSSLWMDPETGQLCSIVRNIRFRESMVEITTTTQTLTDPDGTFNNSTNPQVTVEKITKQEYFKRKLAGEIE